MKDIWDLDHDSEPYYDKLKHYLLRILLENNEFPKTNAISDQRSMVQNISQTGVSNH